MGRIELISKSASETREVGVRLGHDAKPGDLYVISGELGAGKTQLVKGIAKGLDVADWEYVLSPSFTLVNVYEGRHTLCHADLYRIEGEESEGLGIEEYLEKAVVAVEWAERAVWPEGAIRITIEVTGEEERRIVVEGP